jgi:futalosine hydrolase
MNCLIVAATSMEIGPFLSYIKAQDKNIDVLITGIGLTASTYSLCKQIQIKRYDLVIQAGVAGCFNKSIPLGTVVMIKKDTIADQSVIELKKLKTLFDLQLVPHNQFPFKNDWLVNPHTVHFKTSKLKQVSAISVNEITSSRQKIKYYTEAFSPVAESMEGAALHYTCLMEGIPFLQLRSMSNYIGERNKKNWNMKESITNLNKSLISIVEQL